MVLHIFAERGESHGAGDLEGLVADVVADEDDPTSLLGSFVDVLDQTA
jgi:hypothetical protein